MQDIFSLRGKDLYISLLPLGERVLNLLGLSCALECAEKKDLQNSGNPGVPKACSLVTDEAAAPVYDYIYVHVCY